MQRDSATDIVTVQNGSDSFRYIALTGGIGSGKSSVAAWLAQNGARIFDADAAAHKILQSPEAVQWARQLWGDVCLKNTGPEFASMNSEHDAKDSEHDMKDSERDTKNLELDTQSIARIIFSNPQARRDWESFIHPRIGLFLDCWLNNLEPDPRNPLVVFDIPLFFETNWGQGRRIDEVWLVYAPRDKRMERLVQQRGMTRDDVEKRIAAQMSLEEKARLADVVIDNSNDWAETVRQLENLLACICARVKKEQ